ncbi:MAG: 16S rRNA (adenine(1518)-N(6)/adenine(1519)-N(6))-dimethyltransferase RsmA [Pseudomonadota bacterium]
MSSRVDFPPLPPLRELIDRHGLAARKSLGQHFLLDLNITRKIVRLAEINDGDTVFEVGPGPGGLTRAILERFADKCNRLSAKEARQIKDLEPRSDSIGTRKALETGSSLTVIEQDKRCLPLLYEIKKAFDGQLEIVEGDALTCSEREFLPPPIKIISNLPYNISTELLLKWLHQNHQDDDRPKLWSSMALMFQKEVADRILAEHGSKTYGRLSIIAQSAAKPRRGFDLPARAFTPPPKVASSVVLFDAVSKNPSGIRRLEKITRAAFSQRRKMLRTSMKSLWGDATADHLQSKRIDANARAENLSVEDYQRLAEMI